MKRILAFLLFASVAFASQGQSRAQSLRCSLDSLLASAPGNISWSVCIMRGDSMLYAHRENELHRPASTLKCLTAIAALDSLGADYPVQTSLYYSGEVQDGVLKGDLWLEGGLDPAFGPADLETFVGGVKEIGADSLSGRIYTDNSRKSLRRFGTGWSWDDTDDDFPAVVPLMYLRRPRLLAQFCSALQQMNLQTDTVDCERIVPLDSVKLLRRVSRPLGSLLKKMLSESDNVYAECMLHMLASRCSGPYPHVSSALGGIRRTLHRAGVDSLCCRVEDGSGLSPYNLQSTAQQVALLRYARSRDYFPLFYASLARNAEKGTLRHRMCSPLFSGISVHAKTGTLSGVQNLCGYAQYNSEEMILFSIMADGVLPGQVRLVRELHSKILLRALR